MFLERAPRAPLSRILFHPVSCIRTSCDMESAVLLACEPPPRWTFVEGIIVGQFTMFVQSLSLHLPRAPVLTITISRVMLVALFITYVVFEDPALAKRRGQKSRTKVGPK